MKEENIKNRTKKQPARWSAMKLLIAVLVLIILTGGLAASVFWQRIISNNSNNSVDNPGIFTVQRSDLTISVTESGDIKALESKDIKSEVEGRTTIISIVDEGTIIRPHDVNETILVELDSSEIKERLTQQEVTFFTAEATYTDANESLDIQIKQNESDIQAGQLKVRFALMDLQKYLGETIAEKLVTNLESFENNAQQIAALVDDAGLAGEALQELRRLKDDITLAEMNYARAVEQLEGTQELYDSNYVAEIELKGDELEKESKEIQKQRTETALKLFMLYEFPKQAEKLLSDYEESGRELERVMAGARSKLAKARANLGSSKAKYLLHKEKLEKLQRQFKACIIKAPAPGQVVYSSSIDSWMRRNRPIEIGAEIRERQKIISIPDTSQMKVEIKIHETWVDKIKIGQKAKIMIPAFPDKIFSGEVLKKSPLADQQNYWLDSDVKVYATDVGIEGTHKFLKTGMTAKVEIIIDQLKDVLSVPIQAVVNKEGKKVCCVAGDKGIEQREVETGLFNDNFVEIKSGLAEGDKIILNPPRMIESETAI